tara:strand:+ start:207 stop:965 length:759 start_codon:yes stop_codon:yes gene_type:complete
MDSLYADALKNMLAYFDSLSTFIERPKKIKKGNTYVYRYKSSSICPAILQKLARVLTGIQAIYALNNCGLTQEQAAIQRILDDLTEDISFLALSIIVDKNTKLHDEYLDAFYEEEFNNQSSMVRSSQKRPMISRKKIRAYVNNFDGVDDPSTGIEVSRTFHKAYSGYVHGASPQIMELYFGSPPRFDLQGSKSSPLFLDHVNDLFNYFYRAILAFGFSAKAFGDDGLFKKIHLYLDEFATCFGYSGYLNPDN